MFAVLNWIFGWVYKTAKAPTLRWSFAMVGFFTVLAACELDAGVPAINASGGASGVCLAQTGARFAKASSSTWSTVPFSSPKRNGGDPANLRDIDSFYHTQLHMLLRRMLQLAGLPAPEIGKLQYLELLGDPKKRTEVIWGLRATYKVWDKQCAPPAPKLSPVLEDMLKRKDWNF